MVKLERSIPPFTLSLSKGPERAWEARTIDPSPQPFLRKQESIPLPLYICPRPFPFAWFDRLTTNGRGKHERPPFPFTLSLSKGVNGVDPCFRRGGHVARGPCPDSARNHSCPRAGIHPPSPPLYMSAPLPVRMVRQAHHERVGEPRTGHIFPFALSLSKGHEREMEKL